MKVKYAAIFVILSCLLWLLSDMYWIIQSIVEGWFKPVSLVLSILMMSVPIALIALSIALMMERNEKQNPVVTYQLLGRRHRGFCASNSCAESRDDGSAILLLSHGALQCCGIFLGSHVDFGGQRTIRTKMGSFAHYIGGNPVADSGAIFHVRWSNFAFWLASFEPDIVSSNDRSLGLQLLQCQRY